ncbi:RelA/SpoT domain-containing protein [Roseobacter litoralis]|uniref:RelA/SpoT domain-containing protein n=1 Tax=Roseobacter litoralis TaxID=42443 RepID=UPI0024955615|nr:RelA/SpoT domain-containing protein [Roseobacter litoralis]
MKKTENVLTFREIFPTNSKGRVNRAGENLASGQATQDDLTAIENWRASHNHILNTFQANLRRRAKLSNARTPVQRIKRLETIENKLRRYPNMRLARMQDIVGCRVVFENLDELHAFRSKFNRSRFSHKRRMKKDQAGKEVDAYNYINRPKPSGYRGVHDVFEFRAKQAGRSKAAGGERWNGLNIEIQYRTKVQHAWATAVEICDNYTENHGKFSNAPDEYLLYFQIASELLARTFEDRRSCLPNWTIKELTSRFEVLEAEHGMLSTLAGIQPNDENFPAERNTLLIFNNETGETEVLVFQNFRDAVQNYFKLERESADGIDVVLVAADDPESVRYGFKNYFSDAKDFVNYIQDALYA